MASMERSYAKLAHPLHQPVVRIVGVDGAQLRLYRCAVIQLILIVWLVEIARQADGRMRIDQTRV